MKGIKDMETKERIVKMLQLRPMTQSELAEELGKPVSSIHQHVTWLVNNGNVDPARLLKNRRRSHIIKGGSMTW